MCHSPVLRHGDGSAVQLKLRIQGDADRAWRGCVAPRQAKSEVLGGSKEGAEIVDGKFGCFLAGDNEETDGVLEPSLSVIPGPEPDMTMPVTVKEAGEQILSPHPGSTFGVPVLGDVRGFVSAWYTRGLAK